MRSRWRSVVLLLGLSLVLVGCGGGGGGSDDSAVGTAPGGPAADTATARTVVLQQVDMPAGWRGVAHTEDATERTRATQINTCLGRPDPQTYRTAIVYGADLSINRSQVSSIATVLDTVDNAKADLASVKGPKYGDCVGTAFKQDLQRQAPDARIDLIGEENLPVESFGDGSVGLRLTANLVYSDHTDKLFADLVYISKDRTTVSATFFSFDQPFPGTLEQSLVSRMGNRIAHP